MAMESKISTGLGGIVGFIYAASLRDIAGALAIALMTGAAAYLGQTIMKECVSFIKNRFKK